MGKFSFKLELLLSRVECLMFKKNVKDTYFGYIMIEFLLLFILLLLLLLVYYARKNNKKEW